MPLSEVRDVWVAEATPHVPAHRIPLADVTDGQHGTPIACPPHIAMGGVALTRAEAAALRVYPCVRCFAITPGIAGPAVAVLDRGGPDRPLYRP